jgi:hypothetical protein
VARGVRRRKPVRRGQDALVIAPGVWLYQLTDKGVALELTVRVRRTTRTTT